jgi:hypothetical protein
MRRVIRIIMGAAAGWLVFQLLLTLPAAALLFGILWCLQHLVGRLDGMAQIVWNLSVILSMLGLFAAGVILGAAVAWGVAARIASGTTLARSLTASRWVNLVTRRIPMRRATAAD